MKIILVVGLSLICSLCFAQAFREVVDQDSSETSEERVEFTIDFMKDVAFEKAADIGSGDLSLILQIANAFPDKSFVLEDIDSTLCNKNNMLNFIRVNDLNAINQDNIDFIIGTARSTLLPENTFDLVILSSVIHEIDFKDELFADLKRILKKEGLILISDAFYQNPPKPHHGCSNPFMTSDAFESLIKQQQLIVLKDWRRVGISTRSNGEYTSRFVLCRFEERKN